MASQFKTFASGDVLTASEVNSYLMKQAVIVCDASADYPASPTEGMVVYDKALDAYLGYSGSAWVQVMQLGARNTANTWTPTVTQSGSVGVTVTHARYSRIGRLIVANCQLTCTGTGTGSNAVTVSLPVTAAVGGNIAIGSGYIYDASATTNYPAIVVANTTSVAALMPASTDSGAYLGAAVFTAALTTPDLINLSISYEAAS